MSKPHCCYCGETEDQGLHVIGAIDAGFSRDMVERPQYACASCDPPYMSLEDLRAAYDKRSTGGGAFK
jgi:hypothetical protein